MRRLLALLWIAASAACATYEYEEEVFLEVDGSGRIRVSGSRPILAAIHGIETSEPGAVRAHFEDPRVEVLSVRESENDGRRFVHVQARFADWNELCRHPAFVPRGCRLERGESGLELEMRAPPPGRLEPPASVDPEAAVAFRFHFPSTVHFHNSPHGIERGNIIRWERTAAEYFSESPIHVKARFDRRSVLSATLKILSTALAVVVGGVATALVMMVRKGRRQLAEGWTGQGAART